jgi:hypothetical protein
MSVVQGPPHPWSIEHEIEVPVVRAEPRQGRGRGGVALRGSEPLIRPAFALLLNRPSCTPKDTSVKGAGSLVARKHLRLIAISAELSAWSKTRGSRGSEREGLDELTIFWIGCAIAALALLAAWIADW